MPTPTERRALLFLSGLLVLGAGVRASASLGAPAAQSDTLERRALARQIDAVDSARKRARRPRGRKRSGGGKHTPAPRIGTGVGLAQPDTQSGRIVYYAVPRSARTPAVTVDLDVAPAEEIERLPRIGPALARRIVANRDSLGPFGSLGELRRVTGIGSALTRTIAPYVTFSLQPRPSRVDDRTGGTSARKPRGRSRRARPP
jgi:competence protein ComEA